jgi:hypothetical protein
MPFLFFRNEVQVLGFDFYSLLVDIKTRVRKHFMLDVGTHPQGEQGSGIRATAGREQSGAHSCS